MMANTTNRTALLALGLILLSMPAFASSSATASAGATIVDRISIASASDTARESGNRLSVDSSSASGPLAVSIEIDSPETLPSSSVGVADHLQVTFEEEKTAAAPKDERIARKQAPVTMIVHAY